MRKLFIVIMVLVLSLCTAVNGFAAETVTVESGGIIPFEASLGTELSGKRVTLTVLRPNVTTEQFIAAEDLTLVTEAYLQGTADADGKYTFNFMLTDESNHYPVILAADGMSEYKEYDLFYVNTGKKAAALATLTATETTATQIEGLLVTEKYNLGFDEMLLSDTNKAAAAQLIYNHKSDCKDAATATAAINKALSIAGFAKDSKAIFGEALAAYNLPAELTAWYAKDFMTDMVESGIETAIRKDYTTFTAFEDALTEKTVLEVVEHATGFGYVRDILTQYGTKYDITSNLITEKSCNAVMGKAYETTAILKEALEDAASGTSGSTATSKPSLGLGGGGGGGGGAAVNNKVITSEPTEEPEPYETEEKTVFGDLAGFEWAAEAIEALKAKGVVQGDENGDFNPQNTVLREEFLKMIMESVEFADIKGEISFSDVNESDWFYPYVKNAYNCRIVSGMSDDLFGTGKPITRQDMAVMIFNALKEKGVELGTDGETSFVDGDMISDYAKNAVMALSLAEIIKGDDTGAFNPVANATRAEAAMAIYRVLAHID